MDTFTASATACAAMTGHAHCCPCNARCEKDFQSMYSRCGRTCSHRRRTSLTNVGHKPAKMIRVHVCAINAGAMGSRSTLCSNTLLCHHNSPTGSTAAVMHSSAASA